MSKTIPFRRLPAPNPIFHEYVEDFDRVRDFYAVDYRQPVKRWEILENTPNKPNVDLVEGLLEDAHRWNCSRKTLRNIEALQNPDTLAVVTGQQAGLLGGPLYTYYKAVSAVLWAQEIEKQTGRPTVPIFWMETSDHDFFEINHIKILDSEGEEVTLSLTNPPKEKRRVVGSITFNGEIEQLVHRLWNLLPSNTYRGPLLEKIGSVYHPGETIGGAFAQFFSSLFMEDGLIVFDSENARCKRAVAPLLDQILASSESLNLLLDEATKTVHDRGYPAQIQPQQNRLQLFAKADEVRIPLDHDGTLIYDEKPAEKVGIDELRLRAAEAPEQFLPKVSLRPIMQDYLFPTVAYVAGPSEIAYFAQLKPLYNHLDVPMPAIIPRLSMTLIETKIKKILDKLTLTPERLQNGAQPLIDEHLENDPGNDLVGLFAKARKKWDEIGEDLTLGLLRIDPTLQQPLEKSIMRWQQSLNVLEEKARSALSRKNETEVNQIIKSVAHLMPSGHLQERRFSLLYYLVRYGQELGRTIRTQARIDLFEHQLIYLNHHD